MCPNNADSFRPRESQDTTEVNLKPTLDLYTMLLFSANIRSTTSRMDLPPHTEHFSLKTHPSHAEQTDDTADVPKMQRSLKAQSHLAKNDLSFVCTARPSAWFSLRWEPGGLHNFTNSSLCTVVSFDENLSICSFPNVPRLILRLVHKIFTLKLLQLQVRSHQFTRTSAGGRSGSLHLCVSSWVTWHTRRSGAWDWSTSSKG